MKLKPIVIGLTDRGSVKAVCNDPEIDGIDRGFSTLASLVRMLGRASAAQGASRFAFGPGVEAFG